MRSSLIFGVAIGLPWLGSAAACNDNCGRAVAGAARQSPPLVSRKSQCQAFVSATVTVTPGSVTITANSFAERNVHGPRQAGSAPQITGSVPGYASACADVTSYWLACQCFSGVTATTVTLTAAPASTITGSPESSSAPTSFSPAVTSSSSSSARISSLATSSSAERSEVLSTSTAPPPTEAVSIRSSPSQTPSSSATSSGGSSSIESTSPTSTISGPGSTCKPTAILPNPIPLFETGDEEFTFVVLPFSIGVFGTFDTNVYVSVNGRLSLYGGNYAHTNYQLPDTYLPSVSMLAYYDDLNLTSSNHIVAYQVLGSVSGSRNVTFEWVTEHWQFRNQVYHFTATFEEAQPGIVTYRYYTISDKGRSATVGAQNLLRRNQPKFTQYTFDTPNSVRDRTFVRLNTTGAGSFTTGNFETSEC